MYILALDGSGTSMSVAVADEGKVCGEYFINNKKTHSQTLLPAVKDMLSMLELDIKDIDYIAVTNGPGSFTGLRICASTAKGLALATECPIIPVSTTEVLAYNYQGNNKLICPIMDARRGQVYTGLYQFDSSDKLEVIVDTTAVALEEIVDKINELGKDVIFLGDGIDVYKNKLAEIVKVNYTLAPAHLALQKGSSLLVAAKDKLAAGVSVSEMDYVPDYYRLSQAERERLEKGLTIE